MTISFFPMSYKISHLISAQGLKKKFSFLPITEQII